MILINAASYLSRLGSEISCFYPARHCSYRHRCRDCPETLTDPGVIVRHNVVKVYYNSPFLLDNRGRCADSRRSHQLPEPVNDGYHQFQVSPFFKKMHHGLKKICLFASTRLILLCTCTQCGIIGVSLLLSCVKGRRVFTVQGGIPPEAIGKIRVGKE